MNDLFALVVQRPFTLDDPNKFCPWCGSEDVSGGDHSTTGFRHTRGECSTCFNTFLHHSKDGNHWFLDPETSTVLKGMPSHYLKYVYTCNCGGNVHRHVTLLDGETPTRKYVTQYRDGNAVNLYRIFFRCDDCDASIELPEFNWTPPVDARIVNSDPRGHDL